jgi:ubiquinone biosynthesis protein
LDAAGLDRKQIARRNIAILLQAVLHEGFFHADPHAGNFMVLPNETIVMVDFGIMGHLDQLQRLGLVNLFVGMFRQDIDRVVEALSDLGIATKAADRRNLARDLDRLRLRYYGLDLVKIRARSFFEDLMGLIFANRLKMPSDLVLVFKAIAMLEGISLQLDPDLNVFTEVEPYVRDVLLELQSPTTWFKMVAEQMRDSAEAMMLLPKQLQRMLEQIEAGEGNLSMTMKGLDEPTRRVSGAANRMALAVLAAAFVIGPAMLIRALNEISVEWRAGATFLIFAGFGMSMFLTLILVFSIWRSGR